MNGIRFGLMVVGTLLCGSMILGGCGGDDGGNGNGPTGNGPVPPPRNTGTPWDPALGTATINGQVRFEGEAPTMPVIDMQKEQDCHDQGEDHKRAHDVRVVDGVLHDATSRNGPRRATPEDGSSTPPPPPAFSATSARRTTPRPRPESTA